MSGVYTVVYNSFFSSQQEAEKFIKDNYGDRNDLTVIYDKERTNFLIATPKTDEI